MQFALVQSVATGLTFASATMMMLTFLTFIPYGAAAQFTSDLCAPVPHPTWAHPLHPRWCLPGCVRMPGEPRGAVASRRCVNMEVWIYEIANQLIASPTAEVTVGAVLDFYLYGTNFISSEQVRAVACEPTQ